MWGFLKQDDQKASTSTQKEEPLACKESEELSAAAARTTEEKRSSSMTKLTLTRKQHKAEIFWALKSVMSHFSYNSAHDITDVFKAMFPDSIIAQHMSCGPTKLSYLISFGIAPHFMDLLLKELKDAPRFVISFDEYFNEELEKEQMDFIVRYFKDGEVKSRYLSSGFLGHTTAKDLKRAFEECTEKLDLKNLIQLSMDGPNINWKMLDLIVEDRNSNETHPNLLDVGSCSLHVVHGAFRTGMKQTDWGIDLLLKSLCRHLHETPARKEDYTKMTGSEVFPLQFCGHRWLEDKRVAERAVEMWPSLTTYITEILKKPKSQVPTSSSFSTVKSAVLNKLTTAKLEFFMSIAAAMRPYLQTFQSDGPLLPFITSELETLLQTLMGKFMKRAVLEGANSAYKIAKLNVLDSATHVAPSEVDIGFAAKTTLEKVYKEKRISQLQVLEFRKECESMLATIVAKMQERSPLKYNFARKLASLDPRVMVSNPDQAIKMFQEMLQIPIETRWKTSEEADTVLAEYRKLVSDAKRYIDKFSSFKITTDRLDSFLFEVLQNQNESQQLWITMQLILTLSHGQATVERGFSVNKEVLAPNLQETSLVAMRLVHSSMQAAKCKVADFVVNDALLSSCAHARNRYQMYLMERKAEQERTEKGQKRKALMEELTSAKKAKEDLEKVSKKLVNTAHKKAKEAEKQKDSTAMKALLVESNAARSRSEERRKKEILGQEKEIKKIEERIKKIDY